LRRKSDLIILLGVIFALVATPGCGFINKLRAKDKLNEGVRDFNKGQYEAAQAKFERALELSPTLTNAQLFYARAVNARFDQNLTEELGLKTIEAYENIIKYNRDNPKAIDQALAFEAKVYEQLANITADNPAKAEEYKEKRRQALLMRTELPTADDNTKAAVYYTIGQGYWNEAYQISRPYTKIVGAKIEYQPIPADKQERMRLLVMKAHEYLDKALALKPDYADAWVYKKLTYIEEQKIEPNPANKEKLQEKIKEADEKAKKYYELQKQQAGAGQTSS
jgi:tetratricopeptide (TPR) repeat protein